ncbi:hypothetical protein BKA62DRAFT_677158 [Auriculariales sp. MPI-PUGE-AT-0066]|nr:hypothetical protein BKA62DRAFT_677158 [Auriculariales sp. MPI-PUGE-AT-0066]
MSIGMFRIFPTEARELARATYGKHAVHAFEHHDYHTITKSAMHRFARRGFGYCWTRLFPCAIRVLLARHLGPFATAAGLLTARKHWHAWVDDHYLIESCGKLLHVRRGKGRSIVPVAKIGRRGIPPARWNPVRIIPYPLLTEDGYIADDAPEGFVWYHIRDAPDYGPALVPDPRIKFPTRPPPIINLPTRTEDNWGQPMNLGTADESDAYRMIWERDAPDILKWHFTPGSPEVAARARRRAASQAASRRASRAASRAPSQKPSVSNSPAPPYRGLSGFPPDDPANPFGWQEELLAGQPPPRPSPAIIRIPVSAPNSTIKGAPNGTNTPELTTPPPPTAPKPSPEQLCGTIPP